MIKNKPKVISLFTGAMGLDLGLEAAGFETIACVENEKNCIATIKTNKPKIPVYENITEVSPSKILSDLKLVPGEVDLVAGGPPCQAFSTAGKRRSLEDFRGNMIVRYLEYIEVIQPKYFILENVRGILSAKLANTPSEYKEYEALEDTPGSVIYFLTKEFNKLGYKVSFSLFDASYYGVPQKRERFIMFGTKSLTEVAIPFPTTKDAPLTVRDAIGDLKDIEHIYIPLREKHVKYLAMLKSGQYWKHLPEDMQKEAMGKSFGLQGGKTGFYRRLNWDKPSPTVVTHPSMPATMLVHPDEMRPLSIQEYARIQQFPDDWIFAGKPIAVYKQIGNAVPVGLGLMAGKAIKAHMKGVCQAQVGSFLTSRYVGNFYVEFLEQFSPAKNLILKSETAQKQLSIL
jgi:DNA (cytosine-5)-methyltransferase 1